MESKTKRKAKVVSEYNRLRSRRAQIGKDIREDIRNVQEALEMLTEEITIAYIFGVDVGLAGYTSDGKKVKPKAI